MDFHVVVEWFTVSISLFSLWLSRRQRIAPSLDAKVGSVATFIRGMYIDRLLTRSVRIDDDPPTEQLFVARAALNAIMYGRRLQYAPDQRIALDRFHQALDQPGSWETQIASEILTALEDVGIAAAAGAAHLPILLAGMAGQIVMDYVNCRPLIEKFISFSGGPLQSPVGVDFSRRHGVWLAHVAVIYLVRYWAGPECDALLARGNLSYEASRQAELDIRDNEWDLLPHDVLAYVTDLRGESIIAKIKRQVERLIRQINAEMASSGLMDSIYGRTP